ncbi:glycosyltransferase 87 family protein [Actinomadura sp. ATCC 31491]|uniref:Glycosyltransferase 87 family protein n=1 Tax=Actinomadura luzonensis TaxID=2805427 RepID=A0ABT0G3Y0_9ACTN|nr:glycosyltransferase 87 family protein [Actinomadura luzonensis]MCK2219308.1 glycosyltransferase 87 family protein [Actinomadura luzonensis]
MTPADPARPAAEAAPAASPPADARPGPPSRAGRLRVVAAAAPVAGLVVVMAVVFRAAPAALPWWYALAWGLFAAAVRALGRVPAPAAGRLVAAGGLAVIATGLLAPPATSTDSFRYAWDGRVQSAGLSPYDRAPADPALARLRDPWLFPGCAEGRLYPLPDGGCTRINRPTVHTVYPPLAEAYFLLVDRLSPAGARHKPLQVGGALLAAATAAALLAVLRRRGDVRGAALWAWCPAVPMEAVNNAHVDVLAVAAVVVALGLRAGSRWRAAGLGALLGAAVAVKLIPALVGPAVLGGNGRGRAGWVMAGAGTAVVLAYLPYVLGSRASVLGYLSGYLAEEGYDEAANGGRYALLRLLLPDAWAPPAALAVLAAVLVHVLLRGDPARPWRGALLAAGTAFLVLTPGYPWYALLVAGLAALDGRREWLGVPLAGAAAYLTPFGAPAYAAAAAGVLAAAVVRRLTMSS